MKKDIKKSDLADKYIKKETTTTGDIALPPDKASGDTKPAKMKKVKKDKKKTKSELLYSELLKQK